MQEWKTSIGLVVMFRLRPEGHSNTIYGHNRMISRPLNIAAANK